MTVADRNAIAADPAAPPPASPPVFAPVRLRFVANRRDYWRLMIRGNALQAVTLGLYRFWLFTDMRRSLWAGTELEDENFEYTGTALELLAGFMMALGVLIPVNMALLYAFLTSGTPTMSTVIFVVLYGFGQFAAYRARGYRLARTVLRGLRFHQTGSGIIFALRGILWWILIFCTVGLAVPFMAASQERYRMRHTFYGDVAGRFEGSGWRLFLRGILLWVVVIAPLLYSLEQARESIDWSAIQSLLASENLQTIISALKQVKGVSKAGTPATAALVWSAFSGVVLFPAFLAIAMRWWLGGVRIGGAALACDLRKRDIYGAYVRFLLYLLGFSIAFSIVGGIVALVIIGPLTSVIDFSVSSTSRDAVLAIGVIVAYVIFILGCSTIYQVVVRFRIWQLAVDSLIVSGLAALENVNARPAKATAFGEGLADALGTGSL
jgi:uncharacterized membrane protein YjgN (DUF898 family)